jgi:hypothetical protein
LLQSFHRRFSPGVIGSQFLVQEAAVPALFPDLALSDFREHSQSYPAGSPIGVSGFHVIPKPRAPQGLASHPLSDRALQGRETPRIT